MQRLRKHFSAAEKRCRRRVSHFPAHLSALSRQLRLLLECHFLGLTCSFPISSHWMNVELSQKAPSAACINASVEESTISSRDQGLLPAAPVRHVLCNDPQFAVSRHVCRSKRHSTPPCNSVPVEYNDADSNLRPKT